VIRRLEFGAYSPGRKEKSVKNKRFYYVVITAFFCVLVALISVVVLAQHMHHGHDMQAQPAEAFRASTEKPFPVLMDEAMAVMHTGMDQAPKTGEPDRDFVTMMIPHHQGAIDMAKVILLYGKDPQLQNLALQIITDQQYEIQLMQAWLKSHRPATDDQQTPSNKKGGK
jgi:uncharacterized protein (DUF305 family)